MIDQNELQKVLSVQGEVKGVVFQTDANYVLKKMGEPGLKKLEEQIKAFGLAINYHEASALKAYPIGLRIASLLIIADTFGWNEAEIRQMGYEAPKTSFVVKLLMKFFVSFVRLMQEVPKYWQEHYTVGALELAKIDDANKEATLHLKNVSIHPLFCKYLEGYFEKIYEFSLEGKKGSCTEVECEFKGAPYHAYEFKIGQK
jgi:hypothetical protein